MAALVALLTVAACDSRTEYMVSALALDRTSWDSLVVDVSFARKTAIGGKTEITPDSVVVMLFDENYDSLYAGPPGEIPVPDRRLGDRERLTVEACGTVKSRQLCVQDVLRASPKRIEVDADVEYPTGSDVTKGNYEFSFRVQRQNFSDTGWHSVEPEAVSGHMRVWVEDPEAREKGTIHVPFQRTRGTFDLSNRPNFRDFRFFLDSQLLDQDTAHVNFEIYAGLGETPVQLTSVRKEVYWKSDDDREVDVRYFAREGAERLVDELGSFLGGRRAVAYVDDWEFDGQQQIYRLELEVEWDGPLFDRGHYEVEGILEVREDGTNATFELTDANRRGERRWRRRTDEEKIHLGDLGSPAENRPSSRPGRRERD